MTLLVKYSQIRSSIRTSIASGYYMMYMCYPIFKGFSTKLTSTFLPRHKIRTQIVISIQISLGIFISFYIRIDYLMDIKLSHLYYHL